MLYLIGSIVLSSYLVLAFKYGERHGINRLQTIIFNYITCVATGFAFHPCLCSFTSIFHSAWWPYAAVLGCMFFVSFNLMAYTTKHAGITAVSLASKLSMLIPLLVAFVVYKESLTLLKVAGIIVALSAIVILSYQKEKNIQITKLTLVVTWMVFFITGICDSTVKWVQISKLPASDFELYNMAVFMFAAIAGTIALLWTWLVKNQTIQCKNVIAGIAIGVPNYFSLLCLILVLHQPGWDSSVVFPVNNIGIILFSVVVSVLFLKEIVNVTRLWGIGLAILSIIFMTWGR